VLLAHGSGPNTTDDRRIGYAIRYIPAPLCASQGARLGTLVRGRDTHGNFDPEPAPHADLDAAALAAHRDAVERSAKALYAGTNRTQFPCLAAASPSPHSVRCPWPRAPRLNRRRRFCSRSTSLTEGRLQGPTLLQVDRFFVSALARAIDADMLDAKRRVEVPKLDGRSLSRRPGMGHREPGHFGQADGSKATGASASTISASVPRSPSIWSRPGRLAHRRHQGAQWLIERALQVT